MHVMMAGEGGGRETFNVSNSLPRLLPFQVYVGERRSKGHTDSKCWVTPDFKFKFKCWLTAVVTRLSPIREILSREKKGK